jgi:hypothetical protein
MAISECHLSEEVKGGVGLKKLLDLAVSSIGVAGPFSPSADRDLSGRHPRLRPGVRVDDLAPPFLVQIRPLPSMRHRAERDRWRAVRGAFALGFRTRMLRGARIAVMTTGATLSECARVLREQGGGALVDAIVLVRQPWIAHRGPHPAREIGGSPRTARSLLYLTMLGGRV